MEERKREDATSKETLADLEENEPVSDDSDDSDLPSPDGAFDEDDELNNADPM